MIQSGLQVRDALPNEAGLLTRLSMRSKAYWGYDKSFMDACVSELQISREEIENGCVRVLHDDSIVLGFYHLLPISAPDEYELEAMYVEPREMGKGCGRALWIDLEHQLKSRGARRLVVQSDPNAVEFYRAMGMNRIGDRESDSIPGRFLPLLEMNV